MSKPWCGAVAFAVLAGALPLLSGGVGGPVRFEPCPPSPSAAFGWTLPARGKAGQITSSGSARLPMCLTVAGTGAPRWARVTTAPCAADATDPSWHRQLWLLAPFRAGTSSVLRFLGATNAGTEMCVQPDAVAPWIGAPPGLWDCQDAWPEWVYTYPLRTSTATTTTTTPAAPGTAVTLLWNMSGGGGGTLCVGSAGVSIPKPTAGQLKWLDDGRGALFQYNIGLYGELRDDYACGAAGQPPVPASRFSAPDLNVTGWMESVNAYGAKYAVLTTQAGCGFDLWPSEVKLPAGNIYNYTVRESNYPGDLVGKFVAAARAAGIRPGLYYILNNNYFLNVNSGKVGATLTPGQVGVTIEQYGDLVLAQLRELWGNYGELAELWFDGGVLVPNLSGKVAALIAELQPNAVSFQGPPGVTGVRWAGTESGVSPDPCWSTAQSSQDYGAGEPDGPVFAPVEADVTMSATGEWYWRPGQPIKSLAALATIYDGSVGANGNLLLGFHPTYTGALPDHAVAGYAAFGAWIARCYGAPVAATAGGGTAVTEGGVMVLDIPAASQKIAIDRVVVMEDQTFGQRVRSFTLEAKADGCDSAGPGCWSRVAQGQSLGHRRVFRLEPDTASTRANTTSVNTARTPAGGTAIGSVRLTVMATAGGAPATVRSMAVFAAKLCAVPPAPAGPLCELLAAYAFKGVQMPGQPAGVATVRACCSACRAAASCVGFTFLPPPLTLPTTPTASCALYSALGGGLTTANATSGAPLR